MTARVAVSGRAVRTRSAPSAKRSSHRCGACRRVILWLAILRRPRADSGGGRRLRSPVLVALPLGGSSYAAPDLKPSTGERLRSARFLVVAHPNGQNWPPPHSHCGWAFGGFQASHSRFCICAMLCQRQRRPVRVGASTQPTPIQYRPLMPPFAPFADRCTSVSDKELLSV